MDQAAESLKEKEAQGESLEGAAPEPAASPPDAAPADGSAPAGGAVDATNNSPSAPAAPAARPAGRKGILGFFNIYLISFVLLLILGGGVVMVAYQQDKKNAGSVTIGAQNLDAKALAQLANADTTVGNAGQVLNVQSSAIFAGKVLARSGVEVAGPLAVGGNISASTVAATGDSVLAGLQISKDLSVTGNNSIQGQLTVQKGLQVNGSGTFNGNLSATQLTISSLQLNGDLVLTHHITAGGPTPSRTNGSALGGGGTATVSGSDTSGSVTINTGTSPAAGCFITVNFASKFNATPHVTITPVGSSAGGMAYYVNRTTASFSICDAAAPPANASFGFDYFIVD